MADVAAYLEPIPSGNTADLAVGIDPFVVNRTYEILDLKTAFIPPVVADTEAPTIVNFNPAPGTVLALLQTVGFDVVDNAGAFSRIIIGVRYTTGVEEIVHDGDAFTGFYALTSSRSVVATGYRYIVLRQGGWPTAPVFRIFPIDSSGNDGT